MLLVDSLQKVPSQRTAVILAWRSVWARRILAISAFPQWARFGGSALQTLNCCSQRTSCAPRGDCGRTISKDAMACFGSNIVCSLAGPLGADSALGSDQTRSAPQSDHTRSAPVQDLSIGSEGVFTATHECGYPPMRGGRSGPLGDGGRTEGEGGGLSLIRDKKILGLEFCRSTLYC
eukprot:COSAG01_NODE_428_length_17193_cov_45.999123_1_plen_177_part_00